jgi:hypothetical protein
VLPLRLALPRAEMRRELHLSAIREFTHSAAEDPLPEYEAGPIVVSLQEPEMHHYTFRR